MANLFSSFQTVFYIGLVLIKCSFNVNKIIGYNETSSVGRPWTEEDAIRQKYPFPAINSLFIESMNHEFIAGNGYFRRIAYSSVHGLPTLEVSL